MISFESKGSFDNLEGFLKRMADGGMLPELDRLGAEGAAALAAETPIDSGVTADSWDYRIERNGDSASILWTNAHLDGGGVPVAILLQYGHGTGTGGYVEGQDYINPAIKPIFDRISEEVRKAVTSG